MIMRVIGLALFFMLITSPVYAAWGPYLVDRVASVYDGDTFTLEYFIYFSDKKVQRIRLNGVDTPEIRGPECDAERMMAHSAKKLTIESLDSAEAVTVIVLGYDKYGGRMQGRVFIDGVSLAQILIDAGLAREYFGRGKRLGWC